MAALTLGLVLFRLRLCGLRYDSRLPQSAPQELHHGIGSPPEVQLDDLLSSLAYGGTQFMVGP
jgi:hypothetical protein